LLHQQAEGVSIYDPTFPACASSIKDKDLTGQTQPQVRHACYP
jgi:hypothetical protein